MRSSFGLQTGDVATEQIRWFQTRWTASRPEVDSSAVNSRKQERIYCSSRHVIVSQTQTDSGTLAAGVPRARVIAPTRWRIHDASRRQQADRDTHVRRSGYKVAFQVWRLTQVHNLADNVIFARATLASAGIIAVVVCLSVRLSQVGVLLKRLNVGSRK